MATLMFPPPSSMGMTNSYDAIPALTSATGITDVIAAGASIVSSAIVWYTSASPAYDSVKNALIGANIVSTLGYLSSLSVGEFDGSKTLGDRFRVGQNMLAFPLLSYAYERFAAKNGYTGSSTMRFVLSSVFFAVFSYLADFDVLAAALAVDASLLRWACLAIALASLIWLLWEVFQADQYLTTHGVTQSLNWFFYVTLVLFLVFMMVPGTYYQSSLINLANIAMNPVFSMYFAHVLTLYP